MPDKVYAFMTYTVTRFVPMTYVVMPDVGMACIALKAMRCSKNALCGQGLPHPRAYSYVECAVMAYAVMGRGL